MRKFCSLQSSVWLMVLVALALRLAVVSFEYPGLLNPRRDHFPFGYEAGRIARSIVSGKGFSSPLYGETGPTALLPPVYPYLVAGVFKLFGTYTKPSALVLLSLNSAFSAFTCLPVFLLGQRSFGTRVGAWAGWIWALFPHAIYLAADWIWDFCLATLLLSLLFLFALQLERSSHLWAWVGFGLLSGLAALTNPEVLAALPLLAGWICYRRHQRQQRWVVPAGAAALALLVAVTPWLVRNYRTFHQFIPLRDGFWLELYVGNTGDASNYWSAWAHPTSNEKEMEEYRRLGELAYMGEKRRQALEFISIHPGWFVGETLRRILFFWTGFWRLPPSWPAVTVFDPEEPFNLPNIVLYAGFTVLALAGFCRAFLGRVTAALPYALLLLSFPLVYYITHTDIRYRHPIDPEVVVMAAYAVVGSPPRDNEPVARSIGFRLP